MTGIFGVLNTGGPDPSQLVRAAETNSFRGTPSLITSGPFVGGVYVGSTEQPLLMDRRDAVVVADCRVDGTLPGSTAERLAASHEDLELLTEVLTNNGPDGLMGLAADFAAAWFDPSTAKLTLVRDAFGLRPLYYARRGRRFGFASDSGVLRDLGLASSDVDGDAIAAYLARFGVPSGRTGFADILCVPPGSWVEVDGDGLWREGRWFRPEALLGDPLLGDEAVEAARDAILDAVRARVRGRTIGLSLSAGRDSGAIAVALAHVGTSATCFTQSFDGDLPVDERLPARALAEAFGHRWLPAPVPSRPTSDDVSRLPVEGGGPLGWFAFPQAIAPAEAAASGGVDVLFTGQGGEPLFSPPAVAVLDLLRRGSVRDAFVAARNYDRQWTYPYAVTAKAMVRAVLPRSLISVRERMRHVAPWLEGKVAAPQELNTAPRNAPEHLLRSLLAADATGWELDERVHARRGITVVHPLLDLRVVRVCLRLDVVDRAPVPGAKPLLTKALLGSWADTRIKMRFQPYYRRLAASVLGDFPDLISPLSSRAAASGLINPAGLFWARDPAWQLEALALVPLETWLREGV